MGWCWGVDVSLLFFLFREWYFQYSNRCVSKYYFNMLKTKHITTRSPAEWLDVKEQPLSKIFIRYIYMICMYTIYYLIISFILTYTNIITNILYNIQYTNISCFSFIPYTIIVQYTFYIYGCWPLIPYRIWINSASLKRGPTERRIRWRWFESRSKHPAN